MTAFLLVFGLGLDYLLYFLEGSPGEVFPAVALSYGTTALSFGALVLSGFVPVHTFGATVLAGLSAAFCGAVLSRRLAAR